MEWRHYEPAHDRDAAHRIVRALHDRGPVPFTPHPGEWDWWTFHADPRYRQIQLIGGPGGPEAIAAMDLDRRTVAAFGVPVGETIALGEQHLGPGEFTVLDVSIRDRERIDELESRGFALAEEPMPLLERATAGGVVGTREPDGFVVRPVQGEEEHRARATAARRAFASTMDPEMHDARYLRFMRSAAYERERDIVAVAPDGRIGAFAIHWPDTEMALAQFEPVGTDPDFQRRGLARTVIAASLARLETLGIARARIMTGGDNAAAFGCYEACGFDLVDRVSDWKRA
jgi:ribosomal protein S18 acetylase RimI-like enzyme